MKINIINSYIISNPLSEVLLVNFLPNIDCLSVVLVRGGRDVAKLDAKLLLRSRFGVVGRLEVAADECGFRLSLISESLCAHVDDNGADTA